MAVQLQAEKPVQVLLHDLLGALAPAHRPSEATVTIRTDGCRPGPWQASTDVVVEQVREAVVVRHRSGARARMAAGAAEIVLGEDEAGIVQRRLVSVALAVLLTPFDRFLLHAGALDAGRGAVLVLGSSGAGKSTVVTTAVLAGRRARSDDLVVCRRVGDHLEIAGLRRPLAVPPEVGALAELRAPLGAPDDPRGRVVLSPSCLDADWVPLAGTVVVAHGERSELRRLPGAAGVSTLVAAHLAGWSPRLLGRWYPLAAMAARGGIWSLRHDPDAAARVAAVPGLLDQLDRELLC